MTSQQAQDKLVDKYPAFLKEAAELADIGAFLEKFDEGGIDSIWETFRMTYGFASAPRLAVFNKAAQECGARFKSGVQKAYEFVCYICGARYAMDRTTCPNCSNTDKAWRAVIPAGGYRTGKLKKELDAEREEAWKACNPRGVKNVDV